MGARRRTLLAALPLLAVAACSGEDGDTANRVNEINRERFVSGDGSNYRWDDPAERFGAPRLTGTAVDGQTEIDTDEWADSVLVVNFWGSWCPPCVAEAPYLVEAAAEFVGQDVQFLGVNIRDTDDAATAYERRYGIEYPSLSDAPGKVADQFVDYGLSPNDIPATIVIDAEQRVFSIWRGEIDDAETLIADINKVMEA
ncbi:TlpA family protein disulfide reductase [Glycomyces buryatensis]|uniref:TlpA family protein disulfide reductase n=1 Tax=Glycomyces buryatensis TaxID=2570927 RepID=A0A4S8QHU2_9ACTN|nr:TlpA disulfide reductase family protein [Glycomyces buryatensis]THV43311.1 TlpA family protein disulfide reductase [Glycomyces buryatensis]